MMCEKLQSVAKLGVALFVVVQLLALVEWASNENVV